MEILRETSQNFPLLARSLTRIAVKSQMKKEIEANQAKFRAMGVTAGDSALVINGVVIDVDSMDIYQLLEMLKKEQRLAAGFYALGFKREYLSLMTKLDLSDESVQYALDYRQAFPEYINDLDRDKMYKDWGNSVQMLIQPYFPGMIRPIARNFFTLVRF